MNKNKKNIRMSSTGDNCNSCGGELKYYPYEENLRCIRCGNVYEFKKSKDILQHYINGTHNEKEYRAWIKQNKFLKCDSCGAQVMLDKYGMANTCPYCGNHYVATTASLPGLKPDAIIPFKFNEETAVSRFKSAVQNRFFVPNDFKRNIPTKKVYGVYVPAFSFDADSTTHYSGRIGSDEGAIMAYRVDDELEFGNNISGSINCKHREILVETSTKLTDYDINNLQPFEFSEAYAYNQKFIVGYSVEYYQETINHCLNIAKNKMNNEIRYAISKKHDEKIADLSTNTTYTNQKYSYYLLPIYNLEYEYKGKKWITSMNGQTGRINDNLPVSKVKVSFISIFAAMIVLLFILLFMGM